MPVISGSGINTLLTMVGSVARGHGVARLMRLQRFNLVHTHNSKAGFVGRLAARLAKIPLIIHTVHGFAFHNAESPVRRELFKRLERVAAGWCDGMIFISTPLQE